MQLTWAYTHVCAYRLNETATLARKTLNHNVFNHIKLLFRRKYKNGSHYHFHFTVWRGIRCCLSPTCFATHLKQTCPPPAPRWLSRRWSVRGSTTGSGCRRGLWTFVVSAPSFLPSRRLRFRPAFPLSSHAWLGFTSFSLAAAQGNAVFAPESFFLLWFYIIPNRRNGVFTKHSSSPA